MAECAKQVIKGSPLPC